MNRQTEEANEAEPAVEDTSALESSGLDVTPVTPGASKPKKRSKTSEKRPKAIKRKAEETPEQPPPAKQAKTSAGKTSRAGRVIKEKVFVEDSPVCLVLQKYF